MFCGCSLPSLAVALETKKVQVIYHIKIHISKYICSSAPNKEEKEYKDRQLDVFLKQNVKSLVLNA